jgi:DNA-binding Xre family transcriptional regulator
MEQEGVRMRIQYNKLWKLLIDKNMNKAQLKKAAGISSNSVAKLGKNELVRMDVLMKIATALDCKVEDLFETIIGDE